MKLNDLKIRVQQLIQKGQETLATKKQDGYYISVDNRKYIEFRSSSLSFFEKTFGSTHPYYNEFDTKVNGLDSSYTEIGIGILEAVKDEIEGGWLFTIKGLVSAEIFSDFLEMASYLLSKGYKDSSAVMIGSVLEEHLRQLCIKNNIKIEINKSDKMVPQKADFLNSELASSNVYNKLDQKNVTAWLDLRNKAAHGKYTEYTRDQVELMLKSVTDFMIRISL